MAIDSEGSLMDYQFPLKVSAELLSMFANAQDGKKRVGKPGVYRDPQGRRWVITPSTVYGTVNVRNEGNSTRAQILRTQIDTLWRERGTMPTGISPQAARLNPEAARAAAQKVREQSKSRVAELDEQLEELKAELAVVTKVETWNLPITGWEGLRLVKPIDMEAPDRVPQEGTPDTPSDSHTAMCEAFHLDPLKFTKGDMDELIKMARLPWRADGVVDMLQKLSRVPGLRFSVDAYRAGKEGSAVLGNADDTVTEDADEHMRTWLLAVAGIEAAPEVNRPAEVVYEELPIPALREIAATFNVDLAGLKKRDEIIAAIRAKETNS
jgi:DNA-binding transcriptional MerR regulator